MRGRSWRRPRTWFLPDAPDVLGELEAQGRVTVETIEAFDQWAGGDARAATNLHGLVQRADDARRQVMLSVRQSFMTPVSPEDLFELSEGLDTLARQAKDLVREADVLDMPPDEAMAAMSRDVLRGVREIVAAFPDLARAPDTAIAAADRAIDAHRDIEHVYRTAMSNLLQSADLREIGEKRELYRRYARLGEAIEHAAHRIWYSVVKEA